MRKDLKNLCKVANKMLKGAQLQCAVDGYFPRGKRSEVFLEDTRENTAAYRGVQMLIKKIKGEDYQTELEIPKKDVVPGCGTRAGKRLVFVPVQPAMAA